MRHGFSLVELSIVLVILGLLVGGVMTGQSLMRSAQLRAIGTEFDRFVTARNNFRDKFLALPGDLINAYQFWGTACGTNTTALSTGCNGDGDGVVESLVGENVRVWEHLVRAGILEGSYDGTGTVAGTYVEVTPSNVPGSRFPQGNWDISDNNGNMVYTGTSPPVLTFGHADPSNPQAALLEHPKLTHEEAWNVDKKLDDGMANTGMVRGSGADTCFDFGSDAYGIQAGGASFAGDCALYFILK